MTESHTSAAEDADGPDARTRLRHRRMWATVANLLLPGAAID